MERTPQHLPEKKQNISRRSFIAVGLGGSLSLLATACLPEAASTPTPTLRPPQETPTTLIQETPTPLLITPTAEATVLPNPSPSPRLSPEPSPRTSTEKRPITETSIRRYQSLLRTHVNGSSNRDEVLDILDQLTKSKKVGPFTFNGEVGLLNEDYFLVGPNVITTNFQGMQFWVDPQTGAIEKVNPPSAENMADLKTRLTRTVGSRRPAPTRTTKKSDFELYANTHESLRSLMVKVFGKDIDPNAVSIISEDGILSSVPILGSYKKDAKTTYTINFQGIVSISETR